MKTQMYIHTRFARDFVYVTLHLDKKGLICYSRLQIYLKIRSLFVWLFHNLTNYALFINKISIYSSCKLVFPISTHQIKQRKTLSLSKSDRPLTSLGTIEPRAGPKWSVAKTAESI